ncbi:MAG: MotA/TolQ/ExbB proton channel family protein, partial [Proteobacteria bacterium]|nr:MotA/TolQ/ExbB proton channel family protein [Pseudomonadota bacterium]
MRNFIGKPATAIVATAIFCLLPLGTAMAQDKAASLDDLLRQVEQGRANDQREFRERERRFINARNERRSMLQRAVRERTAEENRSTQLEDTFGENEIRTSELSAALDRRLGSLKELFGILQQVSGETMALLDNSLTSIQFPDRGEFLGGLATKMGTSSELASIEEIERLWYELQREMTEQGRVVRFSTTVLNTNGEAEEREVVRVGVFNVVSDGKYLQYSSKTGNLTELGRQPQQARFTDSAEDLSDKRDGQVVFGLDPTSGQILSLLLRSPTFADRVKMGGIVGYIIMALGVVALLIALERLLVLTLTANKVNRQLKSDELTGDNPLGRVLLASQKYRDADLETLELKLGEAILKETPALTRALMFLKIIAVVAPLLGLLGTVTGMIKTFQIITLYGTGDPTLMAGGISQALVTTVQGLSVAIP